MHEEHQIIKVMPKVEIHLHLEGAFTFEFLYSLIDKYGGDPKVTDPADLKKMFEFKNFSHFLDLWFWKNQFFKGPEDFEKCSYTTLKQLSNQNVIYAEVFYSPWDFVSNGLSVEEITEAILSGIHKAEVEYPIKCNLIADIIRDFDDAQAVERVKQVLPFKNKGVIAIGLGGSEQKYPPELFNDAFEYAKREGLHCVVHAGEASGPQSIWQALNTLNAERIGHGVRAIEDARLVNFLNDNQIPLEVCVISNIKTKVFSSFKKHPVKKLYDAGLKISINSDDPAMFDTTITKEFLLLFEIFHFTLSDIRKLTDNAIDSCFLSENEKRSLNTQVQNFWQYTL